jgi:hypothetical protein
LSRAVSLAQEDLRSQPLHFFPIGGVPLRDWVVPVLFEAGASPAARKHARVRFELGTLENRQIQAGTEINCPQSPQFGFVGRDNVILAGLINNRSKGTSASGAPNHRRASTKLMRSTSMPWLYLNLMPFGSTHQ